MANHIIRWLQGHIVPRIVRDVPPELAACEFDCRKAECQQDEWASCPNRKRVESGGA